MKRNIVIGIVCMLFSVSLFAQKTYTYESVSGDPINARIYTLDNGLKVYMSVNKETPKIKVTIATKAGSKLDPSETTGLAHYFEHLMFKGTEHFGTKDWEKEKVLLDQIEQLFEQYRKIDESQTAERKALYRQIDSISQIAAGLAIPNEYDKLMSIIGSNGTNAATWVDFTNYYENIPSNQLENFLFIQADRFQHPVLRLFHTELETIYEEKNMTLTQDSRRASTALMEGLFPHHPYGTQTTIGTQKDLRNPSITNVKKFFSTYYVPNNMAIIMAGDFNPEEAIALIDKYFGNIPSKEIPKFTFTPEPEITAPVIKEVIGKDAENVRLAWRFGNPNSEEIPVMVLTEMLLTNGNAGLVDLNINQKQRTLGAGSSPAMLHDYTYLMMYGSPKAGQSLEEVRDILLEQIENLHQGNFPDWLLQACINDLRLREIKEFEGNGGRVSNMEESFYLDMPWETKIRLNDNLEKITKQQIIDFSKKYLRNDNYVIVYKRKGKPTDIEKVKKPKTTPIKINRSDKSDFVKDMEVRAKNVTPIEPVFVDIKNIKEQYIQPSNTKVYYTKNKENELFSMSYVIDMGSYHDKYLNLAAAYLEYLGTDKYSPEQLKEEFYKLGCNFSMAAGGNRSSISFSGLSKNMEATMRLFEEVIRNAKPNQEALDNLISDILKSRENAKHNQGSNVSALVTYSVYEENSPSKATFLSESELKAITPGFLIQELRDWMAHKQFVVYYGPESYDNVVKAINSTHSLSNLSDVPAKVIFHPIVPKKDHIYVLDYESPQCIYYGLSFGDKFNRELTPKVRMYNEYFGGSMNSIVFQELREARALAYTAAAQYSQPGDLYGISQNISYIACGKDKLIQSIEAFDMLNNDMPENEAAFNIAKESVVNSYRTSRITEKGMVNAYLGWKELGLNEDPRKATYEAAQKMTLKDIKDFQQQHVKGQPRTIAILGTVKDMDMKALKKIGKVKVLKQETVFGY